jgi:uncharacterized protein (TIGR02246 family)
VDRYRRAWETNDPTDIAVLFTEDARYFPKPATDPWTSRDEIVARWIEFKDEPGDTKFSYEVIATDDSIGIVRGVTEYISLAKTYDNLWEIELDGDRCSRFTEWWIERPA